jgi:hypothetical protein
MKRNFLPIAVMLISLLVLSNLSWSQCPEEPVDLGDCDTLHVVPWIYTDTCIIYKYAVPPHTDTICINNPGEKFPCFLYVNLFVTHDSNTFLAWPGQPEERWVQDSISSFTIFLGWTRTNKAKYCSLSTYWNENVVGWWDGKYPRSIWRHFPQLGSDSLNRMEWLAEHGNAWSSMMLEMSSDSQQIGGVWFPPHVFMTLIDIDKQRWWEGNRTLFATLTFRIQDTMTICIDSISKSSGDHCGFVRYDAPFYFPRDNMPLCIWVGPPRIVVTSPNGGDTLCVGSTKDITWLSDNFTDPVKIEYSTNGGQNWIQIEASTTNDGVYSWTTVPNTPSSNCRVKVSDAADGEPKDSSDAPFTIIGETIAVTYPIGGETFVAGDPLSITWNSACFTGSVDILMSEDGGSGWNPIVSGTENDGIYPTSLSSSVSTDQGLIKVSDSNDGIPSDQSDGFFTVRNFTIRSEPETLVVSAGKDTSCKIILESQFGFSLSCSLTVDEGSLPANTTYDFDLNPVVPTDTAILTFHTESSTPSCTSHVIVTGAKVSGIKNQLEHSTEVILIVTGLPPDFSIDASPETLWVPRGYSNNYKVILTSINGFASNCTLSVTENYPLGTTATFNPPKLIPTDSSILTLTIPSIAERDTFTLTITATEMGKGEGITHSKDVILIVTLPTWMFKVEAFPDTQIISQGNLTTYDVTIIPNEGFTSPCTLFVEFVGGLPGGVTANFDSNPIPPNDTSTLTITTQLSTPPDTYDLAIIAVATKKQKDTTYVKLIVEQATDVDEEGDQPNAPDKFALFQNQPNPFNPETRISYYLPEGCEVKLTIYNILGRRVRTLFEGYQNAGMKTLVWDGNDDQGTQLSSGIYFYRLQAGNFNQTRKMSLIK